jgi:hypothetical protein
MMNKRNMSEMLLPIFLIDISRDFLVSNFMFEQQKTVGKCCNLSCVWFIPNSMMSPSLSSLSTPFDRRSLYDFKEELLRWDDSDQNSQNECELERAPIRTDWQKCQISRNR